MKKILLLLVFVIYTTSFSTRADEGMWIPLLIEKLNIEDMQEKGFRLSADDIFKINQAAITDAVVSFGGFCTGELISAEG